MPISTFVQGSLGHEALAYASRGIKVFPLWWAVDGTCQCRDRDKCGSPAKHPLNRSGVLAAAHDENTVEQWWQRWPAANIGLPAGGNGLAIIDVDPRHGGDASYDRLCRWAEQRGVDLTATHTVRTGSAGLHLYYRQPYGGIKPVAKAFGVPGIDTRGRNGYVVAPPSVHATGGIYEVIHRPGLARWPDCLSYLMEPPAEVKPQPTTRRGSTSDTGAPRAVDHMTRRLQAWATSGYLRELDALPGITEGGRNNALNNAAYKAGLRLAAGLLPGHSDHTIHADLRTATAAWKNMGPREINATIRSGLDGARGNAHKLILPPWAYGWTPAGAS